MSLRKKVTLREVARLARVSPSTVSRVVTRSAWVSPEVEARIRSVARKHGLDLESKIKARVIAFVLSNRDMLHPFHSRVLVGAEAYCTAHGWDILFLTLRYQAGIPASEVRLPDVLRRRDLVRAVILAGANSANLLSALKAHGLPFAVLGNNVEGDWRAEDYDVVWSDDVAGAVELTRYFLSLGHRDIWFVGNRRLPWSARSCQGYSRVMQEAGLAHRVSSINSLDDEDLGYLGTKSILSRNEPVSAIIAGTDQAAAGVYRALRDSQKRVADDISVAGFNDTEATVLQPPLTSVREFGQEIGRHLAEQVINRIQQPDLPPQNVIVPTELIKRASCREFSPDRRADADRLVAPAVL